MTKYELLRWLDDPEIQRKILQVVKEPKIFQEPVKNFQSSKPLEEISLPVDDEKLSRLEEENRRLKKNLQAMDSEREILRGEFSKLEDDLSKAKQRVRDLEQQIQTTQSKNSRLESSLSQSEQSARGLQSKLKECQDTFTREQQRAKNLQHDLDAANDKISELEDQLQERFARGWELFQKYRGIGAHARQFLQGVFTRENFMSFICGGAQVNSLETLWDVLRECVMNRRQQDADILGEIFDYCLELVNSSKAQASYSVLPVNVGDRFDSDIHTEAPGSRAQGKVAAVYLPGYRNDYNGKIIRKSIVQVS